MMKLKISILSTILLSISTAAFGQTGVPKPPQVPNVPADVKKLTIKPTVKTPTVTEIVAKYVQAIGGKAASEKIKSRTSKGTIELAPMGIKGTIEVLAAAPDKSLTKMSLAGVGEIIEGYDGKTAWSINPLSGNRDKQGVELAQTALSNNFYRSINLDQLYQKMELKGVEKVGADDAYVIVATRGDLPPETFYFNTKTGLLVRQDITLETPEGKTTTKNFFEDFRDVDGVKMSFKSRTVLPQFEAISIITEVKQNVAVDDTKFTKPKQ